MDIGTTIKNIRKRKGLTQGDLAIESGITQTYLSQIENNLKDPTVSTLKKISVRLQIPLPILFFLSIDENDIPSEKKETFQLIGNSMKSMINEFFSAQYA